MPWVGFEPTSSVFKQVKTVHALDRLATVIGIFNFALTKNASHLTNYNELHKQLLNSI
jgi:hypothetical protein